MKKVAVAIVAMAVMGVISGCTCWAPQDKTCVSVSHEQKSSVIDNALAIHQVSVLPTKDAFRPTFTAGTKRITGSAEGSSECKAINNAITGLCLVNDCDMIAAAKVVVVKTYHPVWFFFYNATYKATISGIPLTMTGLTKEVVKEEVKPAPVVTKIVCKKEGLTKEEVLALIKKDNENCKPAMISLKDIKLSMTASADSDSKIGVKLPANCK